jgi:hypothetical protein
MGRDARNAYVWIVGGALALAVYCAGYPIVRGLILGKDILLTERFHRVEWTVARWVYIPATTLDTLVTGRAIPWGYPGLPP